MYVWVGGWLYVCMLCYSINTRARPRALYAPEPPDASSGQVTGQRHETLCLIASNSHLPLINNNLENNIPSINFLSILHITK